MLWGCNMPWAHQFLCSKAWRLVWVWGNSLRWVLCWRGMWGMYKQTAVSQSEVCLAHLIWLQSSQFGFYTQQRAISVPVVLGAAAARQPWFLLISSFEALMVLVSYLTCGRVNFVGRRRYKPKQTFLSLGRQMLRRCCKIKGHGLPMGAFLQHWHELQLRWWLL